MQRLEIARPDDWHLHLRDGAALQSVVAHTAERFARAIVMPNLRPPVGTVDAARAYRNRILDAAAGADFEPLMTLYLTPSTTAEDVRAAAAASFVHAIKLYPAGATTNSDAGIDDLQSAYPLFEVMEAEGLPLLVHGETTDSTVDVFDREAVFIDKTLSPIVARFPELRVVLEHVTTGDAVAFVEAAAPNVGATITAHHLLLNRNHIFEGGIRPDRYCLPILKRERHRRALVGAATSGSPKFFLGTDSAPHTVEAKYAPCGCAGCYTAHAGIELYAEAFDEAGALDRLEGFASHHGPDFYGLPRNEDVITLVKEDWPVPEHYAFGASRVTPLRAGETIAWRLA